jgi:hypothetical protein
LKQVNNFTWNCTSISEKKINLQLSFGEPRIISILSSRKDVLKILFLQNDTIIDQSKGHYIKKNYYSIYDIPRQQDEGSRFIIFNTNRDNTVIDKGSKRSFIRYLSSCLCKYSFNSFDVRIFTKNLSL